MGEMVRGRVLVRAAVTTTVLLGMLAGPLGTAGIAGVGRDVAERRAGWQAAERGLEAAEERRDDLDAELAAAREAERRAADTLDEETAQLVRRERELDAAAEALEDAQARAAEALAQLQRALAAYERELERTTRRRADLGVAAASAYTQGEPRARAVNGIMRAVDTSTNVAEFLAATERLVWVTRDARAQLDFAEDDLAARAADALLAMARLDERRGEERAAQAARDVAEDAVDAQRERHDAAVAAHEEALERVEQLGIALDEAVADVASAAAALRAALEALRALGWQAGVPGTTGLVWPVDGRPGSGFGMRTHPILGEVRRHLGVDVGAPTGRPVVAADDGAVVHAGPRGGYGLTVVIDHGRGRSTLYAHLSTITVRRGQTVGQAELVGRVGSTGMSTGPHLHFEVREGGRAVDPMRYFR